MEHLVVNGIVDGTIQSAVFDPERSLKSPILDVLLRTKPLPKHHQYTIPKDLNDFVQVRIASVCREINADSRRRCFRAAAKHLRVVKQLARLLRSPTISQDADTLEEDIAKKIANQTQVLK